MNDRWNPYEDDLKCKRTVSLIIVTRGDVSLDQVKRVNEWVCVTQTIIWDNSQRADLSVYGRYAAIAEATEDVILVVDDDVALHPQSVVALCAAYEPGKLIANMPERFRPHYPDSCLVGFGAIFDRDLPRKAFDRFGYHERWSPTGEEIWGDAQIGDDRIVFPDRGLFLRTCDVVFSALTERVIIDAPYTEQPWAHASNRMWKQPEHVGERNRMLELARKVRDA